MTIKVASINFYAGNRTPEHDAKFIESLGFDVIGLQEGHRQLELLKRVLGDKYHIYHHVKKNPTRGSRENIAFIRKNAGLTPHGHGSYKVAPSAKPIKYAPERYLVWYRFKDEQGHKRVLITTHTQPGVQSRSTGRMLSKEIPRVAGYVLGMRAIAKEVRRQRKAGWKPIVTGDLNYRRYPGVHGFVLSYWSPQKVFTRLNMAWIEHAVDYIAWDKSMTKAQDGEISQTQMSADHNWIWATLY